MRDDRLLGHCHSDDGPDAADAWLCCQGCRDEGRIGPDGMPRYLLNYFHERDKCPGPRQGGKE